MTGRPSRVATVVALVGILLAAFGLSISATAASASPSYPPGGGPSISLNKSSAPEGSCVVVFGKNFAPGTVDLTLRSVVSSLGSATADSSGAFTKTVCLPDGVTGAHQICGTNSAGTACADITITGADTNGGGTPTGGGGGGGLSSTGVAVLSIGGLGLVLLVGGGFLLLAGRRTKAAI